MQRAESSEEANWIQRRASVLQLACNHVDEQARSGVLIGRAIADAARKFVNTDLGNGHRLALTDKTMWRIFDRYKKVGPAAFQLNYSSGQYRATIDPILLRLIVEHCLQTGAPLEEAVEAIQPPGAAKITIQKLYRAIPKRALDSFSRTHRALLKRRSKLENAFLRSDAALHRRFLKCRSDLQARMLHDDAVLRRRLLRQREVLQNKFLAADAAAVKSREKLQGQALRSMFRDSV